MISTLIIYSFLTLAVFVWSPLGKALAERVRLETSEPPVAFKQLEYRVADLEKLLTENRKETYQLKENLAFYESLLPSIEAQDAPQQLPPNE